MHPTRVVEAVIAALFGRLLMGTVTGETPMESLWPLLDWRWAFAVPLAALLILIVEMVVNPTAFD